MAEPLAPPLPRRRVPGRRSVAELTLARLAEQGAMGVCLLLLALRLPVAEFGLVSLIVSFQAIAVAASDQGVGLAVLAAAPGRTLERGHLDRCRRRNVAIVAAFTVVGAGIATVAARPVLGTVVALGAALWALSAEAYVRKSCALRLGAARPVARAEVAGSVLLLATVAVAAHPGSAAVAVAVGFGLKSAFEALRFRGVVETTFAHGGDQLTPGWIWGSQVLAYVIANVDYALVGLLLGSRALGLYGLAFRAASLLPVQLNALLVRLGTVDLAQRTPAERAEVMGPLVRRLLLAGTVVGIAGALCAPLVGPLLGDRWADAGPLMVPLFLVVPWRILLPVVGMTALVDGRAATLCRLEGVRLAGTAAALLVGAAIGVRGVAVLGSLALVAATTFLLTRSTLRPAGVPVRLLMGSGGAAVAAVLLVAWA